MCSARQLAEGQPFDDQVVEAAHRRLTWSSGLNKGPPSLSDSDAVFRVDNILQKRSSFTTLTSVDHLQRTCQVGQGRHEVASK